MEAGNTKQDMFFPHLQFFYSFSNSEWRKFQIWDWYQETDIKFFFSFSVFFSTAAANWTSLRKLLGNSATSSGVRSQTQHPMIPRFLNKCTVCYQRPRFITLFGWWIHNLHSDRKGVALNHNVLPADVGHVDAKNKIRRTFSVLWN